MDPYRIHRGLWDPYRIKPSMETISIDLILIEWNPYRVERSRASPIRIGAYRIDPYKIDAHIYRASIVQIPER